MSSERKLLKKLKEKFKEFSERPIDYDIDEAIEILENDTYEDIDLIIWVNKDNEDTPTFFNTKEEALEYIENMDPEVVSIEFSDSVIIDEVSYDLMDYINETCDMSEYEKMLLVSSLTEKYIIDNKEYVTDDYKEVYEQIKEFSGYELLDYLKEDCETFQEILVSYCYSVQFFEETVCVAPNENFYKEKNIRFINEICRDILLNFHNQNFKNGNISEESINIICKYLNSEISLNEEYYLYYFGDYVANKYKLIRLLILMVISDYYRYICLNKDDISIIDEETFNNIEIIQNYSNEQLLSEFELNDDFSKTVVKDFIRYNNSYNDENKKEIPDQKTLKKIDPFFNLNKIVR